MDSINFLGSVLFWILGIFAVYNLYIVFCSTRYKIWKLRYKYNPSKFNQNLSVVIYSHNQAEAVVEILENLKKQHYPQEKMDINIILDNCNDNSSNLLEILGNAKIWRINTGEVLGRNQAIEWFLDRILAKCNSNAFVFLDAKNQINPYLLSNINNAISEFPVVTGKVIKHSDNKFLNSIITLSQKLKYDLNFQGRSMAGLPNMISTEILAIRQSVLERVRFMGIEGQNTEVLYSTLLAKSRIPILYSDEINAFEREHTTLFGLLNQKFEEVKNRAKAFAYCYKLIFRKSTLKCKEMILSLVYPCDIVIIGLLSVLISMSKIEWFSLGYYLPHYLLSFYIVTTLYSGILAKLTWNEVLCWPIKVVASPFIILGMKSLKLNFGLNIDLSKLDISLPEFKIPKPEFKGFFKRPPEDAKTVFVTAGGNDIECKLEEINEDGLYRVALWFKNKNIKTQKHLRINDALTELSDKLINKGLALKVCQNCGYFQANNDGKHDCRAGICYLGMIKHEKTEPYSTQVSNTCKFIIPSHAREYVQKQLQNMTPTQ